MSAAAQVAEAIPAPPAKGKKKLIIIVAAALLVTTLVGGGTVFFLKKKAAAAAEAEAGDEDASAAHAGKSGKHDPSHVPTFLPLEPFVVNLADKEADRYAQIGVTLEIDDAKFAEQLKAYMPAIRNGILMVLAHKTSAQLLDRAGKVALADEIMREAVRPLGIEIEAAANAPAEKAEPADDEAADDDKPKAKKKPKKKPTTEHNPVRRVHFSNFIIQ